MKMIKDVFLYFLRLGATGFGGPIAVIGILQKDLVEEKKWIGIDEWQRAFTFIKALPGPVAFMCSVFLGQRRAGFIGALAAGIGLVLPAFLMMIAVSITLSQLPESEGLRSALVGLQVGGLVAMFVGSQGIYKGYERDKVFWFLALAAAGIGYYFYSLEPLVILCTGAILVAWYRKDLWRNKLGSWAPILLLLFWVHFKAGAFVFGTGLAIIPMLQYEVVQANQWMTTSEFLNALTFGQITPGPVVITSTMIGWKVAGLAGAFVATFGVFLASFIHMTTWFPRVIGHLGRQAWMNVFLRGALAAVTGFIGLSILKLFLSMNWTWVMGSIFLFAYYLVKYRNAPLWAIIPLCGFFNWL
jgi:chromate transporter